ncbi:hypothetical protein Pla52o_27360 [Novipirellula galeiformis]|uniref:Uncharacterized protein n=1 Tax=Novipirellula galeiformis TaxID=2528004 RepID=A0A5C6CIL0_9BACT|nr:hypothetical protein Pla52o_27360 [Novipirellula galeiformis]
MKLPRTNCLSPLSPLLLLPLIASVLVGGPAANAQVRTKKPDRGVYRPPMAVATDDVAQSPSSEGGEVIRNQRSPAPVTTSTPVTTTATRSTAPAKLIAVPLEDTNGNVADQTDEDRRSAGSAAPTLVPRQAKLRQVGHNDVVLMDPTPHGIVGEEVIVEGEAWPTPIETWSDQGGEFYEGDYHQGGYGEVGCGVEGYGCDHYGCDGYGCDGYGCDSLGCGQCGSGQWSNASLVFRRDRWFANFELLLMFRSGDFLPPLFTTGPASATKPGSLANANTRVLAGGGQVLNELTAGGRITLGTWLDDCRSRSMVFRGWGAGDETYNFNADQLTTPIITRPFLNVTNDPAAQDTQVVATPGVTTSGFANVHATSELYGADFSIRQHAYSRFGGTVDLLYGYQYMHLSEGLTTSSTSTAAAGSPAPLGSIISISDSFDAENNFHGGQIGIASRYREGCWSFNSLFKVAAGNLRRESRLAGQTEAQNGLVTDTRPTGLLVRSTNAGTRTDDTFAWVPEIDLSLGWRYFPRFDVTVGYHIIAMTEAIQVSGLIDNQLASNLDDTPTGSMRPSAEMDDQTFYVHGIHFGLQYVY